jgi:RHS repeat-associated protein
MILPVTNKLAPEDLHDRLFCPPMTNLFLALFVSFILPKTISIRGFPMMAQKLFSRLDLNSKQATFFKIILFSITIFLCIFSLISSAKAQGCGGLTLSTSAGPGFKQVTHSWTGIGPANSSSVYSIYGRPAGGGYGDPIQVSVAAGESKTFTTNSWGIVAPLDTYKTYNFYIYTSACGGQQSNVTTATTIDIATPQLSIIPGPGMEEVTYTFTGVSGSDGAYSIYGKPAGASEYGSPFQHYNIAAGQTITVTTNAWGIVAPLATHQIYNFYVKTWSGTRIKDSSNVSVTTRDIDVPKLTIAQENTNQAKISWGRVDNASSYVIYTFSSAQNQWNALLNVQQQENLPTYTYIDPQLTPNQTRQYYVTANRTTRSRPSNIVSTAFYQDQNQGNTTCNLSKGEPVNLSNGNMYINQTDYGLRGSIESIDVRRTYNSSAQFSGLFGGGWSSIFDENIILINEYSLRMMMSDGRAVYFGRTDTSQPFTPSTAGFYGQIVRNADLTFTLTLKDGRTQKFSSGGRLLWMKDRNGNQTTLNYDISGILTGITDVFGRTLTVTVTNGLITQINDSIGAVTYEYYNGTSRLKTVIYSDGSKYQFEYNAANKLTFVRDSLNNILEKHDYDPNTGWATTSEKQGGVEKYTFDYAHTNDQTNPYTTVTDANQKVSKLYLDKSRGRNVVIKTEGVCSCGGSGSEITTFEYDTQLNLMKKVDALNREMTYTYDPNGNRLTQTEKVGTNDLGTDTFTYNSFGQVLTWTDKMSGVTTNTYDASGNLKTTTDALGKVTTVAYPATNNKGLPDSVKDARNNVTKFKWFPASGLLQEVEDANLKKTTYTYDARGRTKTVTNALGYVTTYNYFDDTQRKVEMIYPNLDKITYKYDVRRLLESMTDERGKVTNYTFDNAYRLTKITDPLLHTREYDYDLMSNLKLTKDGLGNQTDYNYDDFNRLREIKYPLAEVTAAARLTETFTYDPTGRIKQVTDTAGRNTVYDYYDAERRNTVTNTDGEITTTRYNARSQMIQVTDAKNQVYDFTYDPLGRMLTQTRAGGTMTYIYDAVGNRAKRIDYLGRETGYEYDNLNRLKKISYLQAINTVPVPTPIQTAVYTYDELSRLKTATNDAGTVSFNYDNRNRIKDTTDVFGHLLEYNYTLTSTVNQRRLKFDSANYADYNYDNANRLANILNSADNSTISFGYDNANRMTSRNYPNNITTTYGYDNMSRLKQIKDVSSTATLFDRNYRYNTASQIDQISEPTQTRTFGYDNVDRLLSMTSGTANESYNYDDVGNRTSSHRSASYNYQTGQFNRVSATASSNYAYDANGNTVTKIEGKNFWRFTWDYENRLTTAATRKQTVRYRYDALGRRVQRYFAGTKENTKFIYDGNDVLVDDNSGTLTKYLNGDGIDDKLRVQTGNDVKYFLADHLGSTNALTDSSGNITSSASYDSFGNATGNLNTRYQFTGREFDNFSGLQYSRTRWYDGNLGRFISEDPIGFRGGDVNLYGYVWNNSQSLVDPTGLDGEANGKSIQIPTGGGEPPRKRPWMISDPPRSPSPTPTTTPSATPMPPKEPSSECSCSDAPYQNSIPGTLQIGLGGSGILGFIPVVGSVGVAVDTSGNVGFYYEGGSGSGIGADFTGGVQVQVTNASSISGLKGVFVNPSIGLGDGIAATGNLAFGHEESGGIVGIGGLFGVGGGAAAEITATYTGVPDATRFNIWNALGYGGKNGCRK